MTYKLRAECSGDIARFIMQSHAMITDFVMAKNKGYPDCELLFNSSEEVDAINVLLDMVPDSNVMKETLAPIEQYTGLRTAQHEALKTYNYAFEKIH
jgi:hypothetical protein